VTDLMQRLLAQARRFHESGATPVTPRPAATVLLLRPAATGFEVYLLRRAASMVFASGVYAFPGGSVDPRDADGDPLPGRWAERLGRSEREAQAVVRAAVRETAEETGVRLDPADLVSWRRWITPEFEPRRYDTYFFVAALPPGQEPADVSGEADRTEWLAPAEALRRFESGRILMLPPTSVTLRELSAYDSIAAVLAAASTRDAATPVLPRLEQTADGEIRLVF